MAQMDIATTAMMTSSRLRTDLVIPILLNGHGGAVPDTVTPRTHCQRCGGVRTEKSDQERNAERDARCVTEPMGTMVVRACGCGHAGPPDARKSCVRTRGSPERLGDRRGGGGRMPPGVRAGAAGIA